MLDRIYEALMVMFVGMGIVFAALTFFYLLILALKTADEKINKLRASKKLSAESLKGITEGINPEIVAVIAAAAFEILQKPVRVKKITFLTQEEDSSWARTGRLNVITSHNILKR